MKRILALALALMLALSLAAAPAMAASSEAMLKSISPLAHEGEILNCDFKLEDSYSDLVAEYGKPNRDSYVASAKGSYGNFNRSAFVVGHTNQEQIFELRCYSKRLKTITARDVVNEFGEADHRTSSGGETIMSYVLSSGYNLKFVFDGTTSRAKLNHYNVIWLDGTANDRAGEPGRNW